MLEEIFMSKSNIPRFSTHRPQKNSASQILQKELKDTSVDQSSIDPAILKKLELINSWSEEPSKEAASCLS
jgi:hypothetical protein